MRTLLYARYSSQLQNARSIGDQVALLRARADLEGWPIVEVFTDHAVSGGAGMGKEQRPGLHALLERVEAGGIDQVFAESTDRLARHQGDDLALREQLEYAGVRLFTLMEGEVDEITGTFKGLMNKRFRSDLGVRMLMRKRERSNAGSIQGSLAYGYRVANRMSEKGDLVRGLREIVPAQAEIVVRIFREFAAGQSAHAIVRRLNEEGVPPPKSGFWRTSTIRGQRSLGTGLLANRLYIGELVYGRTHRVLNPRTRRYTVRKGSAAVASERLDHLRIIDDAVWEKVQQQLDDTSGSRPERQRRPKHLLSGLGRCGVCGGKWIVVSRNLGVAVWGCARHQERACTNNRMIINTQFEKRVLAELREGMLAPDVVSNFVREYHREHARQAADLTRDHARVDRKLAEAGRKIDRLVAAIAEGASSFTEIRDVLAATRKEQDALTKQRASIEALPVLALHPGLADEYRRQMAGLETMLNDPVAQIEAIPRTRALIDHIEVVPSAGKRGVALRVVRHIDEILKLAAPRAMLR